MEDGDTFSLVAINDLDLTVSTEEADNIEELITEIITPIPVTDEFETAAKSETPIEIHDRVNFDESDDTGVAVLQVNAKEEEGNGVSEVRQLHGLEDADPFLKFVCTASYLQKYAVKSLSQS